MSANQRNEPINWHTHTHTHTHTRTHTHRASVRSVLTSWTLSGSGDGWALRERDAKGNDTVLCLNLCEVTECHRLSTCRCSRWRLRINDRSSGNNLLCAHIHRRAFSDICCQTFRVTSREVLGCTACDENFSLPLSSPWEVKFEGIQAVLTVGNTTWHYRMNTDITRSNVKVRRTSSVHVTKNSHDLHL